MRQEKGMEGRQGSRDRRGQYHQQCRASVDQNAVRTERRGLQVILSRTLPYGRRASVLDTSECRFPVPSDWNPVFPEGEEQSGPAEKPYISVLQPGIRD